MSHAAALAEKLVADAYGELFYYPQHDETITKIWNEPGNPAALEALIDDPTAPAKARFVAAEVLFARDLTFIGRRDLGMIARIYAIALQRKMTRHPLRSDRGRRTRLVESEEAHLPPSRKTELVAIPIEDGEAQAEITLASEAFRRGVELACARSWRRRDGARSLVTDEVA